MWSGLALLPADSTPTPMIRSLRLGALLLVCLPCSAQQNRDDLTPMEIRYTTTVPEGAESMSIGIDIDRVNGPILHLSMPVWAPGSYRRRNYSGSVENLVVEAAGEIPLEATRIDDSTWSVATGGHRTIHVAYDLPPPRSNRFTRRSSNDDAETTGFSMSGPGTYMYVRGAKGLPVTSTYDLPEGWRVANGLLRTDDPFVRWARDYDTFIDAPSILGHFEQRTFEVAETPIHCVFFENSQQYDFDLDGVRRDRARRSWSYQGEPCSGASRFPNYCVPVHDARAAAVSSTSTPRASA